MNDQDRARAEYNEAIDKAAQYRDQARAAENAGRAGEAGKLRYLAETEDRRAAMAKHRMNQT
jgi:hypothetical protein